MESWNTAYRRRRHEVLLRHRVRKQQRAEEAVRRRAIERQLEQIGAPTYITKRGGGIRGGAKVTQLNLRALSVTQLQAAEIEAEIENARLQTSAPGVASEPLAANATVEEQRQRALEDAQRLQEELTTQSLLSEEGYREFQSRISKEEKRENLIKVNCGRGSELMSVRLRLFLVHCLLDCRSDSILSVRGEYRLLSASTP